MKSHISKIVLVFFCIGFLSINVIARSYIISFTGSGKSTTVESVIVQNLTRTFSVTVPAGNTLNLYDGADDIEQLSETDQNIYIYPTSSTGKSTVSFYAKHSGTTQITAFNIDGRKIVGTTTDLQFGVNSFQITLPKGSYIIRVSGYQYTYNAKMINPDASTCKPEIVYVGTSKPTISIPQKSKSSSQGQTSMLYYTGDQLLFKGISGNNATIVPNVPTSSKTIDFYFDECVDGDGNNYSIVKIGTQTWMVENLKTTRYKDLTAIPNVTVNTTWENLTTPSYCWYNNDINNKTTYGGLYNWYAIGTGKLAPTRWHVATDAEWTTLETYLTTNGYNLGKSLAATTNWDNSVGNVSDGDVGKDYTKNNASGFTALPCGLRMYDGTFGLLKYDAEFWSATQENTVSAWSNEIDFDGSSVRRSSYGKAGGYAVRCIRNLAFIPTLITTEVSSITSTSAMSGASITSDGNDSITVRGLCWNTTGSPTINNSMSTDGISKGSFTRKIVGLTPNTTYYVRAYATNSEGTAYGNEQTFTTTSPPATITDIDGNVYNTVILGTQTWLVENLKTTKYNDGTNIPLVSDNTWGTLTTPAYCWYSNDVANKTTYGALYNWYTANTGKLAPTGWHVPTDAEWSTLENYLIANGYNYNGTTTGDRTTNNNIAKSLAATTNWTTSTGLGAIGNDLIKNNSSGFSALPGGWRSWNNNSYTEVGTAGYWMSTSISTTASTNIMYRSLNYSSKAGVITNYQSKSNGYSVRCIRDNVPTITTTAVSAITSTTAFSGGNVTDGGYGTITARGICWSTSPAPTIALTTKTIETGTTGVFSSLMTNLTSNTKYYMRSYATNSGGTSYGTEVSFTTLDASIIADVDGNIYTQITIGTQTWMVENLKTTRYRDGSSIANVTDNTAWAALTTGAWCESNNNAANSIKYGHLYNWYAVSDSRNIAPVGWHIPTDAEWTTLTTYLGGESVAGGKLKETGTLNWLSPNTAATNSTGFSALPGGQRSNNGTTYSNFSKYGYFWTATMYNSYAYSRSMNYASSVVTQLYDYKASGNSVRCIKD
ncbi:MAG: FISUMP domain-containing protein [Paludibacter sp.]